MSKINRCGWFVLMGPTNAVKSTLTNALIGQKVSIVTSKQQTTRNCIVGLMSDNGEQTIFLDTPGLHHDRSQMRGQLGKIMHQAVWQSLSASHCTLLVLDADLYLRKPEFLARDTPTLREALAQ